MCTVCGTVSRGMYWCVRRRVVVLVVSAVLSGILCLPSAAADEREGYGAVFTSDLCQDDGAKLFCDSRQLIHIRHLTCGDGSHACAPEINETMFRLCEGQRTCAGLGLRNIMRVHCMHDVISTRHVTVQFTCSSAPPNNPPMPCRTNLCSNNSRGLTCPSDSVIHVRHVTCLSDIDPCPWATYTLLYTLCEGSQECEASGLRLLLSSTCDVHVPRLQNVFVDYVCVPKSLTHSKCNGQHKTLQDPFGLLMSPGFVGGRGSDPSSSSKSQQCSWIIARPEDTQVVHVTVHVAQSSRGASNCTPDSFLQVQYKACDTSQHTTVPFCYLQDVSANMTSCGPVKVSGWLSDTSSQTDRFLVSFHIVPKGSSDMTPANMSECISPVITTSPVTTTSSTIIVTPRPTVARARNYGPGGTMFDYSDTIRQTAGDDQGDGEEEHSTVQFKLVILYVFFGVVIIALVIALVYVLVSYRGISRRGRRGGDSSEKAALWRSDDTPLDTFNHNSHASLVDAANNTSNTASNHRDSQVVATVHAESTDEEENRFSSGSGFSSFLPGRDTEFKDLLASLNPYATIGGDNYNSSNNTTIDSRGGAATLPRRYSGGSGGGSRHSRRSNSLKMNGDLGDIYETIDAHQYRHNGMNQRDHSPPPPPPVQHDPHYSYLNGSEDTIPGEENIPLVHATSPARAPSPPLPPPPPSIATDYPPSDSEPIDHYIVNNDEYALVRKHKTSPGLQHTQSSTMPASRSGEYTNGGMTSSPRPNEYTNGGITPSRSGEYTNGGMTPSRSSDYTNIPSPRTGEYSNMTSSRSGDYTNVPCLTQERNSMTDSHSSDPMYDSVEFKMPQDSAPVVNFRPTSGPYDRDRNSKADQNVSPTSGASRHRWDEDL